MSAFTKTIAAVYVFTSASSPGKTYQTLQYIDGSTSCECSGWLFRKKVTADGMRTCKHTRAVECGVGCEEHLRIRYTDPAPDKRQRNASASAKPETASAPNGKRFINLEEE